MDQGEILGALPGRAKDKCVVVGSRGDVRSGGIGMGNFARARRDYVTQTRKRPSATVSMYVIPQHTVGAPTAKVTLRPPGGGAARTLTNDAPSTAGDARYYPMRVPVTSDGVWRIRVVAGKDQGCFVVRFG